MSTINSYKQFKDIYEIMPIGVAQVSLDFIFQCVNPAFCILLGYTERELIGMHIKDVTCSESLKENLEKQEQLARGEIEQFQMEKHFLRKDGSTFCGLLCSSLIKTPDGSPSYFLGTVIDINKQKKMEENLRQAEARQAAMIANISDVVSIIDKNGIVRFKSSNIEKIFGWNPDEIVGTRSGELIHPDDRGAVQKVFENVYKHPGITFSGICRYRCKDGRYCWSEYFAANHFDTPEINGILLNYRDITDRIETQQLLRENEERYRAISEYSHNAICIIDEKGKILWCNEKTLEMTGYSKAQILSSQSFHDFIASESIEFLSENMRKFITDEEYVHYYQFYFIRSDGEKRLCETHVAHFKTSCGEKNLVVHMMDVTEQKMLIDAAQRADRLDSLGLLAGGIAHDFNNMLAGIFGYIELAQNTLNNPEKLSTLLKKTLSVFDRAQNLTQQLLTFSKGGEPSIKSDDIRTVLEENASFALSGSSVICEFDFEKNLKPCLFDRNQIAQVIDNILINAQHAMPQGGKILISASNVWLKESEILSLKTGPYLKILISDTGTGMPENVLKHLFDPFFTTKRDGTGLGLSTAHSIIKKHAGEILVSSEPQKGSVFTIYLPAAEVSEKKSFEKFEQLHSGSGQVIIMDDESFILEILAKILEKFGYEPICTANGGELLEKLCSMTVPPVFMILDLTVHGGLGGLETLAEIKKHHPDIPVFATSGYSENPVIAYPSNYGFTGSITKPFMIKTISDTLDETLKYKEHHN